jgi:hypothetical protein
MTTQPREPRCLSCLEKGQGVFDPSLGFGHVIEGGEVAVVHFVEDEVEIPVRAEKVLQMDEDLYNELQRGLDRLFESYMKRIGKRKLTFEQKWRIADRCVRRFLKEG